MRRLSRGVTLAELLVASGLAALCIGLAIELLIPALRAWSDCQKQASIDRELLVLYRQLDKDVGWAIPKSIIVDSSGRLSMSCAESLMGSSQVQPRVQVSYWRKNSELLRTSQVLEDSAANDIPRYLSQIEDIPGSRTLACDISELEFEVPQSWLVRIHVVLSKGVRSHRGELMTAFASHYAPITPAYTREKPAAPATVSPAI